MAVILFAAILLTLATKAPVAVAMAKQPRGYNNIEPRVQQAALEGAGRRALAAHANGWEALIVHAAALCMASASGVADHSLAVTLAWAWFPARIAYTALYVAGTGVPRTLAWFAGFGSSLGLIAVAAGWLGG